MKQVSHSTVLGHRNKMQPHVVYETKQRIAHSSKSQSSTVQLIVSVYGFTADDIIVPTVQLIVYNFSQMISSSSMVQLIVSNFSHLIADDNYHRYQRFSLSCLISLI